MLAAPADLLDDAVSSCVLALEPTTALDWTRPATDLTWSVFQTAEHIAGCLIGYAGQVVGQPASGWVVPDIPLEPGTTPTQAVAFLAAAGKILSSVVRTSPAQARGYHPYGTSDPEGFAAMGVVESLVHTHDIRLTAGQPWPLPEAASAFALRRLFPDAPDGPPADVLLWCTGRTALGERPRQARWRWDGSVNASRPR